MRTGSKISEETKGKLRERRRIDVRHERQRWDGDEGVDVDDGVGAGNTESRETVCATEVRDAEG